MSTAQASSTDSIPIDSAYVSKVVRLINDFKSCKEYSSELENRLESAREIISRTQSERNEYKDLLDEVDNLLDESEKRKRKLEKKLKRTRIIGAVFGGVCFILGVLLI